MKKAADKDSSSFQSLLRLLVEYAIYTGAERISKIPGLWTSQIDAHWLIKCNGHLEEIEGVSPLCWEIQFDGQTVGVIGLDGYGGFVEGETANELSLRNAILARMPVD